MIREWFLWRRSPARIHRTADQLIAEHGAKAFFRAHQRAWAAQGDGRMREARFWQAVSTCVCARLRRQEFIAALLARKSDRLPAPERRLPEIASNPLTISVNGRRQPGRPKQTLIGVVS